MAKSKQALATYVLRSVLGIVRVDDDIEGVILDEVINEYELLYAELKHYRLAQVTDDNAESVSWQVDAIPEQCFKAVANIVGARCAPLYSVEFDPVLEEEAKRWLYKTAQIPTKRKPMVIRQF